MKQLKCFGSTFVAMSALMALATTASATTITSPTGTVATPTIHAVTENGHGFFTTPIAKIECSSTLEAKVTQHGSGVTAGGGISSLVFPSCTNSWNFQSTAAGSLEIHWTSGYNGTLTSSGTRFSATRIGITCVYDTANTSIGTITGGNPATLHINGTIPINAALSHPLCGGASAKWEANYVTTSALYVDP